MSKREIEVGDKVRVKENLAVTKKNFGLVSEMEKMIGNVFDVKVRNRDRVDLNFGSCNWCFHINDVELVEPTYTWTSKFNIGDKVVDFYNDVQTVKQILFDGTYVEYFLSSEQIYLEDNLELYEEPKVKEVTIEELEEQYGCKVKVVK